MAEEHEGFAERLVAADRTAEPAGEARARREQEVRDMLQQKLTTTERVAACVVAAVCCALGVRLLTLGDRTLAEWHVVSLFWRMMLVSGLGMFGMGGLLAYLAAVGERRQPGFNRAVALGGGVFIAALGLTFIRAAAEVPEPVVSSTLQSIGYLFMAILAVTLVLHVQEERDRAVRIKLLEIEMKLDELKAQRDSSRA